MKRMSGLVLCLLLMPSAAAAQKPSKTAKFSDPSAYKLVAVKVTGTSRYSDKEILAASGLQIGQNAADGDFKEAVRVLGDSGLFSDVSYSYSSSGSGVRLDLQVADNDKTKLVPVHFENIVWFTDDELHVALQTRVPLFTELLPVTGNLADHVSEALQAILTEKRLPGRVDYLREGNDSDNKAGDSVTGIVYRVDEVNIRIRNVEFPGASPEQTALLATAARRLVGAEYGRTALAAVAKFDLLPVYLQRGYLKATFAPCNARVLPTLSSGDSQGPAELEVDAILPVAPGKVYSATGADWKGNVAISTSQIATLIQMPPGQPADAVRLIHDVDNVIHLYRSHGYMMAQINSVPQFDDEKSTVHYDLNVIEGDLYKMGELDITGLDSQAKAKIVAAWKLSEGEPYNADYPKKFLRDTDQLLPRGIQWAVTVHETPDPKDKTVDVEIRFKQQ